MSQPVDPTSEAICRDLAKAFAGRLTWKWDGRFGAVLAEFSPESKASVLGTLDRYLASRWDSTTITNAPETAKRVKAHLGGLMAGQLLLLSDPEGDSIVYCAWWPWGNGLTISIRIGILDGGSGPEAMQTQAELLRGAFAVE